MTAIDRTVYPRTATRLTREELDARSTLLPYLRDALQSDGLPSLGVRRGCRYAFRAT